MIKGFKLNSLCLGFPLLMTCFLQESRPQFITVTSTPIAPPSKASTTITMEPDTKDNSADILHNLLGVDVGSIDQMLDSADSAAKLLGM